MTLPESMWYTFELRCNGQFSRWSPQELHSLLIQSDANIVWYYSYGIFVVVIEAPGQLTLKYRDYLDGPSTRKEPFVVDKKRSQI